MNDIQKQPANETGRRTALATLIHECRVIAVRLFLLLLGLYVNRKIAHFSPTGWIIVPALLALALMRAQFREAEKLVVRLWQLIGLFSAIYSLLHYPLMPPAQGNATAAYLYGLLLFVWVLSLISGAFCFRIPSLSILPPAFLLWSNPMAEAVTGLQITTYIDVQPLTEVSVCIGLGLLVNQVYGRWGRVLWNMTAKTAHDRVRDLAAGDAFAGLLLLVAISVHLANYYYAFYSKITLDGPWGAWITENNPAYIFLAALDDGHIIFSGFPKIVQWVYGILDAVHVYSNFWVLIIQAAAIIAFFLSRRAFFVLLLMFDVMHVSIILIAGANFWPWIILNVIIATVVASARYHRQPIVFRLIAMVFILLAPHFVQVTRLGWYDVGANNKLYFEAVDDSGKRHEVPTNFFTFYSYSISHMDYGMPDPETAFATLEPNGGTWYYDIFKGGRRCAVAVLNRPDGYIHWFDRVKFPAFIRNYHQLALAIDAKIGAFPYNVYPHHSYVPHWESEDFDDLDKRRIVAYIYRRESVCLTFDAGALRRKMVSSAEYRIDVDGVKSDGRSGN